MLSQPVAAGSSKQCDATVDNQPNPFVNQSQYYELGRNAPLIGIDELRQKRKQKDQ